MLLLAFNLYYEISSRSPSEYATLSLNRPPLSHTHFSFTIQLFTDLFVPFARLYNSSCLLHISTHDLFSFFQVNWLLLNSTDFSTLLLRLLHDNISLTLRLDFNFFWASLSAFFFEYFQRNRKTFPSGSRVNASRGHFRFHFWNDSEWFSDFQLSDARFRSCKREQKTREKFSKTHIFNFCVIQCSKQLNKQRKIALGTKSHPVELAIGVAYVSERQFRYSRWNSVASFVSRLSTQLIRSEITVITSIVWLGIGSMELESFSVHGKMF